VYVAYRIGRGKLDLILAKEEGKVKRKQKSYLTMLERSSIICL